MNSELIPQFVTTQAPLSSYQIVSEDIVRSRITVIDEKYLPRQEVLSTLMSFFKDSLKNLNEADRRSAASYRQLESYLEDNGK